MQNRIETKQDKFFDELLESLKPSRDEIIERKIYHLPFAKIIVWLCLESRKKFIFTKQELKKFTGLTSSRVQEILNDFINAGVIKKGNHSSGKTYFVILKDDSSKEVIVRRYFDRALKTLGKKPKKKIIFELEEEMKEEDYF